MRTVLVLAALVAFALGSYVPHVSHHDVETKPVDAVFVDHQKKILSLFYNAHQVDPTAEYYTIGSTYDVEKNIDKYSNKKAVEDFLRLYRVSLLPKAQVFSIFIEEMREQAISLFQLFYYANDFKTFYETACFARVHMNEGLFLYTFYTAVIQRTDCADFVLPAPYEIYPELFINKREVFAIHRIKEQNDLEFPEIAAQYGIVKENEDFVFYANYSDGLTYPNEEQRLAYFTEDVGLNSFYYYFHSQLPFWWNGNRYGVLKERRGELYFYFYQQLLARYYLERLSNGLGEIPSISWYSPVRTGYYPFLSNWQYPFAQRSNYYNIHSEQNWEAIRFLDIFEKTFFQYLQTGHFKAFDENIDFHDPKAINFVGNYWQSNADLYGEEHVEPYQRSYEVTARRILGGAPKPFNEHSFMPSALDFYQTSLRDPAFYQLYNKIFDYMVQYKEYLRPYHHDDLHFVGVKINDVKVEKLVTFFDLYDFEALNLVYLNKDDVKPYPHDFKIRQPRLNHEPFSVTIDVKSDVASEAIVKMWIGPKYDSDGFPIRFEDNWMNFFELDWFVQKLEPGVNKIVRKSQDFFAFKEDSLPAREIWKLLGEGKIPVDMSEEYDSMPKRLMLPKGTPGGYPYQIFVFVYQHNSVSKEMEGKLGKMSILLENKPFGFPLDRPVMSQYFNQPNMFFEDVLIYHEGEMHPYNYAYPQHTAV